MGRDHFAIATEPTSLDRIAIFRSHLSAIETAVRVNASRFQAELTAIAMEPVTLVIIVKRRKRPDVTYSIAVQERVKYHKTKPVSFAIARARGTEAFIARKRFARRTAGLAYASSHQMAPVHIAYAIIRALREMIVERRYVTENAMQENANGQTMELQSIATVPPDTEETGASRR